MSQKRAADGPQTAQIDIRMLAAVSAFASKEETRYYLNGVSVEIKKRDVIYVATDGHRLVAHRQVVSEENTLLGSFTIPTEVCRRQKVSKSSGNAAVLARDGAIRLSLTYDASTLAFRPIDGQFVSWRRVIPKTPASGELGHFNYRYVADFAKFAETMSFSPPFLLPNGKKDPALVLFDNSPETIAILMPQPWPSGIDGRYVPNWAVESASPPEEEVAA